MVAVFPRVPPSCLPLFLVMSLCPCCYLVMLSPCSCHAVVM